MQPIASSRFPFPGSGLFDARSRMAECRLITVNSFIPVEGLRLIAYPHNVAACVHLARTLHTMSGLGLESWHVRWFDDESLITIYK